MTRDIVAEIEAVRERSRLSNFFIVGFNLGLLKTKLDEIAVRQSEILGYFPIAVVAHLEVFFRHVLRDLLDEGEPFLARADDLIKQGRVKLDSSVAVALAGRRVTFGELIAASLGYSDWRRACGYVSTLLGSDVLARIRSELEGRSDPPDVDSIMARLSRLYEIRHIIAHEARPDLEISHEAAEEWIEAAWTFMEALSRVIEEALFPDGIPATQAEMNRNAMDRAGDVLNRLEMAYTTLRAAAEDDLASDIETSHAAWIEWAQSAGQLAARILAEGGSMAPTLEHLEISEMAREEAERIESLVERCGVT